MSTKLSSTQPNFDNRVMICRGLNSRAWIPLKMGGEYFYDFDKAVTNIKKHIKAEGRNTEIKLKLGERIYIHTEN